MGTQIRDQIVVGVDRHLRGAEQSEQRLIETMILQAAAFQALAINHRQEQDTFITNF